MHIDFAHANPLPKVRSSILIGVETPCTLAASGGITREQVPDSSSGLSLSTNADDGLAFRVCDHNHTAAYAEVSVRTMEEANEFLYGGMTRVASESIPADGFASLAALAPLRRR